MGGVGEGKGWDEMRSVVIPAHQEVDALIPDEVDQTVFLSDPSRPDVGPEVAEWLGLSDPLERVSEHGLDELEDP
jgi:hypothetical protein